jgi:ABC-type multidrug transport system fused ATPase/permease subunit
MSDSQHLEDALEDQDANQKVSFETIVRVLAVTKPYWHWLVGFLLAIAIVSVLDSVITYQTKRLVDDVIVPKNFSQLTPIISQYLAFYATLAFFVFVFIRLASVLGERVQHDLRAQMFDHLQRLSFSYFDRTPARLADGAGDLRCATGGRSGFVGVSRCDVEYCQHQYGGGIYVCDRMAAGTAGQHGAANFSADRHPVPKTHFGRISHRA